MQILQKMTMMALIAVLIPATVQAESPAPVQAAKKTLAVGQTAKDFQLKSVGGELSGEVKLSDVNADGKVVVVVLRGFPGKQCPACSAQVGDFVKNASKFAAKNAKVLLIYPGPKSQLDQRAGEFLQGTKLPTPLTFLLDPGYTFTDAYGLRWDAPRETAYPTTLVLDESGEIQFVKISETHRGRASAAEVLEAL
ncbi:AhpC/TSA family protein [Rosistilla carotiformis]|uniref:thioredoxin-dependent peroxiredoxin n=1 Tax=Rosistilla carotiformis TaxID=2528017 RepID=A0A518JTX4_9BACT|nr:peroxiredoxin family protein [Rosistilla carotiformis]QDV68985.1 AhpC/TSA family protein [Rosistilla carotiformis]